MVEALRAVLAVMLAVSLCLIAAYVVGFLVVSVVTVYRRVRPDPLYEDLDRALEEILGRSAAAEPAVAPSRRARRRGAGDGRRVSGSASPSSLR